MERREKFHRSVADVGVPVDSEPSYRGNRIFSSSYDVRFSVDAFTTFSFAGKCLRAQQDRCQPSTAKISCFAQPFLVHFIIIWALQ